MNNELGDGVEQPVKGEGGGNKEGVALALHDGFLVTEMLGRRTRLAFTSRSSLVLPVNIHEEKQAKGYNGKEGFEKAVNDGDQAFAEWV